MPLAGSPSSATRTRSTAALPYSEKHARHSSTAVTKQNSPENHWTLTGNSLTFLTWPYEGKRDVRINSSLRNHCEITEHSLENHCHHVYATKRGERARSRENPRAEVTRQPAHTKPVATVATPSRTATLLTSSALYACCVGGALFPQHLRSSGARWSACREVVSRSLHSLAPTRAIASRRSRALLV